MNDHLTEDEQVEAFKKWWKENGIAVVLGVVLGLGGVIGFWQWQSHTEQKQLAASDTYVLFNDAVLAKDTAKIQSHYKELTEKYDGTSYATLAALLLAKQQVDENNLAQAVSYLESALEHASYEGLAHIARLRLARIYLVQEKYDMAEALAAEYAELKGDIHRHRGNTAQARESYQLALTSTILTGKSREYVEMKLNSLGPQAATTATDSASSSEQAQ